MIKEELIKELKELIDEAIKCYPVDSDKDLLELLLWFMDNVNNNIDELSQVPRLIGDYVEEINDEVDIEFKELLQKIREIMDNICNIR